MQRQTVLSIWSERIIEGGWLLALSLIPIYFNLLSARHFEPDKATTLRAIVLIMAAAGLVRVLEQFTNNPAPARSTQPLEVMEPVNPFRDIRQRLNRIPLALPALLYTLVFLVTTFTSVVPLTSFWGSYQRLQGTYTNLSYIGLFILIVATLRRHEQLERLITVTLLTGLTVAGYGILQHFQLDPLPWRGDVITRVASTMGNSIFVAAYMIMVVPLALYRLIVALHEAQRTSGEAEAQTDLLWGLAYGLLVVGTLALLLMSIKFGAVVRTFDFRYWWVFPGAIVVATAFWITPTLMIKRGNRAVPLWPGAIFMGYLLLLALTYVVSASSGVQSIATNDRASDWGLWLAFSILSLGGFYTLAFMLPQRSEVPSRLAWQLQASGAALIGLALLVATFFTQSRGPWIGLGAGLFVFFVLLFLEGQAYARTRENLTLANRLRAGLWAWMGLTLLAGGFLIIFNLSNAPFFEQLREVPYIGRMGRLLEVDDGTGRVRVLIWFGDEHADGVVGMISADPLRTLIGWGPESMFVAYNQFYPPDLTSLESRGASPDRSHQAIFDELATKGLIGLISYLFLLISFFVLCWRLLRRSQEWHRQVFFIACFSIVTSHFVEGLTGIPIVSTLMLFWVTLGITVTGGLLAGQYSLSAEQQSTDAAEQPAEPAPAAGSRATASRKSKKGRGATTRGAAPASPRTIINRRTARKQFNPAAVAFYALLLLLTLGAVWWFNVSPIYADMRFQQGQSYTAQAAGAETQVRGMVAYLDSIHHNPREDFYYLNLGRTLMNLANEMRVQGVAMGTMVNTEDPIQELLALRTDDEQQTYDRIVNFLQQSGPVALLSYAEAVLEEARELNPRNKDHYANLGRLNNFWYNWTRDPSRLEKAADWFRQATDIAPQDVTLLNEYAGVIAMQGSYAAAQDDAETAEEKFAQAEDLLQRSRELDERYADTDARLADLYRLRGDLASATDLYVELVEQNPHQLDTSIETIASTLQESPDLLRQLRDAYAAEAQDDALLHAIVGLLSVRADDTDRAVEAYARAATLQPQSLEYRRNYTIILSDTRQYDQALAQARAALELAQSRQASEMETSQLQALVAFLEQRVAGGQ